MSKIKRWKPEILYADQVDSPKVITDKAYMEPDSLGGYVSYNNYLKECSKYEHYIAKMVHKYSIKEEDWLVD